METQPSPRSCSPRSRTARSDLMWSCSPRLDVSDISWLKQRWWTLQRLVTMSPDLAAVTVCEDPASTLPVVSLIKPGRQVHVTERAGKLSYELVLPTGAFIEC